MTDFSPAVFLDTDTDTDTGNVQSRTYAMGEAAIRDRARMVSMCRGFITPVWRRDELSEHPISNRTADG